MDAARGLVTKLCDEGKWLEVKRSGIEPHFMDDESGAVLNFIDRHFTQYKSVPGRDAVKNAFPNYTFASYSEPLDYFIDEIKEGFRRSILEDKFETLGNIYTSDSQEAERVLRETIQSLQITSKTHKDINVGETALDRYESYLKYEHEEPEDGILSGWPKMDYMTLGYHPEEFIVAVGEKWVGKSWTILWNAYQAVIQNERVLIATQEMSPEAIIRRFDSIYASVSFDSLRRRELTEKEKERYKEKMHEFHTSASQNLIVAREGIQTIDDIETKAVEVDATIVFADSVYLFAPDSKSGYQGETAKRLAISQKCKRIARNLEIPVVVSVQAGRKKSKNAEPDLDDIEWSNAFSQDADTVFYIEKTPLDAELNRRKIHLLKSRDGDATSFYIDADFEYMTFGERSDKDEPTTDIQFDSEDTDTDWVESLDFNG